MICINRLPIGPSLSFLPAINIEDANLQNLAYPVLSILSRTFTYSKHYRLFLNLWSSIFSFKENLQFCVLYVLIKILSNHQGFNLQVVEFFWLSWISKWLPLKVWCTIGFIVFFNLLVSLAWIINGFDNCFWFFWSNEILTAGLRFCVFMVKSASFLIWSSWIWRNCIFIM